MHPILYRVAYAENLTDSPWFPLSNNLPREIKHGSAAGVGVVGQSSVQRSAFVESVTRGGPAANGIGVAIDPQVTDRQRFYRVGYKK
ncbi:MAG: hypothetical protein KIS67_05125 [Verrucomicrobiae bacterium]|nr:hypothetical protein [Verrucomicrobiae bacterium]